MPSRETIDLLTTEEFITGFVFGASALALGVLVARVWRRWRNPPASIVGVLLTGASLAAIHTIRGLPGDLWVGVGLLTLGGVLYPWARRAPLLPAALAIPGAWWLTRVVELPGAEWTLWLLFGWVAIGAPLVTSFDRHFSQRGYGPVLLVVSIAGMFTTLPDTEDILTVLAVAVPLAFLAWPKVLASLGAVGVYPALGLMAWVIAAGGRGRESAIVGATACLALLAVEPLVRWWRRRTLLDRIPDQWSWVPVAAGLQLVFVLLAARAAGLSNTPQLAALVASVSLVGGAGILAAGGLRPAASDRL